MEDGAASTPEPSASAPSSAVSPLQDNAEAGPSRPRQASRKRAKRERNPFGISETRWYSSDLSAHAKSSRSLLDGRSKPFKNGVVKESDFLTGLRRSIVPPATVWEVDEKCRFFAALSRHSRLRPDLIAADVRTKNVMQVERYLKLLEGTRCPAQERGPEVRAYRDHHLCSGAYEGSEAWVEREEDFAGAIERARENDLVLKPLRGRHAFVKWGHDLTLHKMKLLHKTNCAAEESLVAEDDHPYQEVEDGGNPIENDNREIAMLEETPKKERSPAERKRLTVLKNRRRNRQNYRRKQLNAAGYTDETIDAHGGPDDFLHQAGYINAAGARRKSRCNSPDTQSMIDLDLHGYLTRRGWELFHFERMSEAMELYHGIHSTDSPRTSFDLIGDLFADILAYVRQLVYTSLVLAEQEPHGESNQPEATADHVRAALALRGIPPPALTLHGALGRLSEPPGGPSEANDSPATESSRHLSADSEHYRHPPPRLQPILDDITSWQALEQPQLPRLDDCYEPLRQGTETDEEDEQLDLALEQADAALDSVMNAQLLAAADRNDKRAVVDVMAWFEVHHGRGNPRAGTSKAEYIGVTPEAVARLREAQDHYSELVKTSLLARRKRKIARQRTKSFPWHQGYLQGGRMRTKKSKVDVNMLDIDDERPESQRLSSRNHIDVDDEELSWDYGSESLDALEWDATKNDSGEDSDDDLGSSSESTSLPDIGDGAPRSTTTMDTSLSTVGAVEGWARAMDNGTGNGGDGKQDPLPNTLAEFEDRMRNHNPNGHMKPTTIEVPHPAFLNDDLLVGDEALDSDSD